MKCWNYKPTQLTVAPSVADILKHSWTRLFFKSVFVRHISARDLACIQYFTRNAHQLGALNHTWKFNPGSTSRLLLIDLVSDAVNAVQISMCVMKGQRPDLSAVPQNVEPRYKISTTIEPLMCKCWAQDRQERPEFSSKWALSFSCEFCIFQFVFVWLIW